MEKDGLYVGFQGVDFGVNSDISVGEDGLHLGECVFRQSCSSMSHLASGIIVKPRYLKVSTCFVLSPLLRILHTRMSNCFEMIMHSVFFAFSKSFVFTFDCDCCKDVSKFFFRVSD